jgi:D-alanyl-D-alanine carboxypeptidase
MYHHKYFKEFYDSLPIAGVDGTIKYRMRGTSAEGNIRAKTGTIENVRALSGYATTKDGETIIFSMIVNNYIIKVESAEYIQDRVCELLTSFSRHGQ